METTYPKISLQWGHVVLKPERDEEPRRQLRQACYRYYDQERLPEFHTDEHPQSCWGMSKNDQNVKRENTDTIQVCKF